MPSLRKENDYSSPIMQYFLCFSKPHGYHWPIGDENTFSGEKFSQGEKTREKDPAFGFTPPKTRRVRAGPS